MGGQAIGVFDSGFGGLSILKDIIASLPQYRYVYLGDNARAPYGDRPPEEIHTFTRQAVEFLVRQNCGLIIIACNTSSAEALRKIQQEFLKKDSRTKMLGVIVPAVEEAVERAQGRRIGVLATEGTVRSGTFVREIKNRDPSALVFQNAAPLLVPLIEAGEHRSEEAKAILRTYLAPLLAEHINTLILGCTHYAHMEEDVRELVGADVRVVSEGPVVASKLREYLLRHPEIETTLSADSGITFHATGAPERFQRLGTFFFGSPVVPVRVEISGPSIVSKEA